jgi:hypothetical protein
MTKSSSDLIAQLLGLSGVYREEFESYLYTLEDATGRADVIDHWVSGTQAVWESALQHVGATETDGAAGIIAALEREMQYLNMELLHFFRFPDLATPDGWHSVMGDLMAAMPDEHQRGRFLKYAVAEELLRNHPPASLLAHFGANSVDDLLASYPVKEIYAALRFAESNDWMQEFVAQYDKLTPDDFEEREIEFLLLPADPWFALAKDFSKKKLHPFSHLKELGLVFLVIDPKGVHERDLLRVLITLVLHYLYEVSFYARYFDGLAKRHTLQFGQVVRRVISGDIIAETVPKGCIRITHQYYTKRPDPDQRVYEPHVMPEPLHWQMGRGLLTDVLCRDLPERHCAIDLWATCYNVGRFVDGTLISMNFADNIVSNSQHKTYHLYEDIWNSLFTAFFSRERLERALLNRLEEGYIDLYQVDAE